MIIRHNNGNYLNNKGIINIVKINSISFTNIIHLSPYSTFLQFECNIGKVTKVIIQIKSTIPIENLPILSENIYSMLEISNDIYNLNKN